MFDFFLKKRQETKAARVLSAVLGVPIGRPIWSQKDFRKLVAEGYERNVIVFRCIEEVSKAVASVPLRVMLNGEPAPDEHPAVMLLRRPNPQQSRAMLVREMMTFLLISGDTYIERVRPGENRPPLELWTKRPDRMKAIVRADGLLEYEYTINGKTNKRFKVDARGRLDVLHLKMINPLHDVYGLSPIVVAALNIDQHNEGDTWTYNLLKNGAGIPGVLTTEAELSDEAFERVRKQMENFSGAQKAGKTPILEGGLKWTPTGLNPKEMTWLENKDMTARFICQAFGVPPHLLGLAQGSTFANVTEARVYFWDTTITPMTAWLAEELTAWLAEDFDGIDIVPDFDSVPALESRRQQRWERIEKASFLTINEKRGLLGFPPIEGGDDVLVPMNLLPAGSPIDETQMSAKDYALFLVRQGVPRKKAQEIASLMDVKE